MKRVSILLSIVISVILLFGCQTASKYSKELKYNYFPETDWGMSKEEVFKALSINESDFKMTQKEEGTVPLHLYTADNIKVSGVEYVGIQFQFTKEPYIDEPMLTRVYYALPNPSQEKFEKTYQDILSLAKGQEADSYLELSETTADNDGNPCGTAYIKCKTKTSDLSDAIKEKFDAYSKAACKEKYGDSSKATTADVLSRPLSTITVNYMEATNSLTVSFSGNTAASVMAALEAKY